MISINGMKHILVSSLKLIVLVFVLVACSFISEMPSVETPTSTAVSETLSPVRTSSPTSVPVVTPSLISTSTPTLEVVDLYSEYQNDYFALRYDITLWEEDSWQLSGPPIRLPALFHRSLKGCRIGFRRGGWSGNHEIKKVTTDVELGEIGFHIVKTIISEDDSVEGVYYTAYDIQTGEAYLPSGMDFWLGRDNLEAACIRDVEQVLATLRALSTPNP